MGVRVRGPHGECGRKKRKRVPSTGGTRRGKIRDSEMEISVTLGGNGGGVICDPDAARQADSGGGSDGWGA